MVENWPHLQSLKGKLAPKLDYEVGLLIGYDCSEALFPREVISAPRASGGPFGMRTDLGWGIVGVIGKIESDNTDLVGVSHRVIARPATDSQIVIRRQVKEIVSPADCLKLLERDFLDRTQHEEGPSVDERRFLHIMEEGVTVDSKQRYSLPLPFNDNKKLLFDNEDLVLSRVNSLKCKMNKDSKYRAEYTEFMEEMISRGYAEEVSHPEEKSGKGVWYLPHFGVYHKMKGKLWVVFDCAAKYRGTALNDTLLKGPDYLNSLLGILCRFRLHPIAFSCDIEKMFYAFRVHPEQRDYLRFLWWRGGDTRPPLTTYRVTAHLFGAVSSPACASFGLRRIAQEFANYGGDVLDFISNNFYVDDGLKSVPTEEMAISLVRRTVEVCKNRGVRLHKFVSNSGGLLKSLPDSECATKGNLLNMNLDEYPAERVLGILWNINSDCFQFKVNLTKTPESRRGILSATSSVFDTLGWVAPFMLKAKMVLQQLCQSGLDWDVIVPDETLKLWRSWYEEAEILHQLNIQRCLQIGELRKGDKVQLHHFADASERAYGACSYVRIETDTGRVLVHLIMAKSRVAPLASVTVPRIELMAAVVATRLSVTLEKELRLAEVQHYYWTDCKIVLGYLRNEVKRFKIFVANRVQQIHDVSDVTQWRHIAGVNNPADLASRGLSASNLVSSELWFKGPPFLQQENIVFDNQMSGDINPDDPELRKAVCNSLAASENCLDTFNFSLFSSWRSLTRGIARAKRLARMFKDSISIKARLRSGACKSGVLPLTVADLQAAERLVVKSVQFPTSLRKSTTLKQTRRLAKAACYTVWGVSWIVTRF